MRTASELLKHRVDDRIDTVESLDERVKLRRWQTKQLAINSVLMILCVSGSLYYGTQSVFIICAVAAVVMVCARVPEWIPSEQRLRFTQNRRMNRLRTIENDELRNLLYLQYKPKNVFERMTPIGNSLLVWLQAPLMVLLIAVGLLGGPIPMVALLLAGWGLWGWLFYWADRLDGLCNATLYLDDEGFWFSFQETNKPLEETDVILWSQVQSVVFTKMEGKFFTDPILQVRVCKHLLTSKLEQQILSKKMLWPVCDGSAHSFCFNIRADAFISRLHRKDLIDHLRKCLPPERLQHRDDASAKDQITYTELWMDSLSTTKRRNLLELHAGDSLACGKYAIIGELDSGGQATAYTATDEDGQKVVVKEFVLPAAARMTTKRRCLENIDREAKLLAQLHHPQIVRFIEFFVEDQRAYLVTEHIDGLNLRKYCQGHGPFAESTAIWLALQMCDILEYLHDQEQPIVHRDFTPDNLIFANCDTLKLIDFNVAQQLASVSSRTVVGKHAYIPPEQFRGKATIVSDVYALGATMFFLLTGIDPEPISASHPREHRQDLTADLDAVVAKATSPDEAQRYQNAREIKADLVRLKEASTA